MTHSAVRFPLVLVYAVLLLPVILAMTPTPAAAQPAPTIQINADPIGSQSDPAVATQSTGEMFFIWDRGARRFLDDGTPLDAEDFDPGVDRDPDVAMNEQGDVVIVGLNTFTLHARLYAFDDSVPPSDLIEVHGPDEAGSPARPSVAIDATGSFVVVYTLRNSDIPDSSIWLRRYDPNGNPLEGPQRVSTSSMALLGVVAMRPNGEFAIAWQEEADIGGGSIFLPMVRFYENDGTPATAPIPISTVQAGFPNLDYTPTGELFVTYGNSEELLGVRFDLSGQLVSGPTVLLGKDPDVSRSAPHVTALASGEFHLVWSQFGDSFNDPDVYSLRLDTNGMPQGSPVLAHRNTNGQQKSPDIDAIGNEPIMVFNYPDGNASGIAAACFLPDGCVNVFLDSFESGDTSAWSASLP